MLKILDMGLARIEDVRNAVTQRPVPAIAPFDAQQARAHQEAWATVIVAQPIYLAAHEVSQTDYERVMGKNPACFAATGPEKERSGKVAGMDTTSHTVEGVSCNDAADFCLKLSQRESCRRCRCAPG